MKRLFVIVFVFGFMTWAWTQTSEQQEMQSETLAAQKKELQKQLELERYELTVVEQTAAYWLELDRKAQAEMEKKLSDEILIKIKRDLFIKEYLDLIQPKEQAGEIRIALLGNSARFLKQQDFTPKFWKSCWNQLKNSSLMRCFSWAI